MKYRVRHSCFIYFSPTSTEDHSLVVMKNVKFGLLIEIISCTECQVHKLKTDKLSGDGSRKYRDGPK